MSSALHQTPVKLVQATDEPLPFVVTKKRHFNLKPDQNRRVSFEPSLSLASASSHSSSGLNDRTSSVTATRHSALKQPRGTTGAMATKLYGRDLREYEDLDIDTLLSRLTVEELEELNNEVDPDNHLLPPRERCREQTTKPPTGAFDRERLVEFLEESAKKEKDWDEAVPFVPGKQRGKLFVPKQLTSLDDDDEPIQLDVDEELALNQATDQDLVDLAAYLGMHSVLSQTQYWNAIKLGRQDPEDSSISGIVKSTIPKVLPQEPPNSTDVEKCIKQLKENLPSLTRVNINNMKETSRERIRDLISAAKNNNFLKELSMANTALKDEDVKGLVDVLENSKTLSILNLESNFLSGDMLANLLRATLKQQSLTEFRAANQRATVLGNKIEMDMVYSIEENGSLLRVGISFEGMGVRHRVAEALERNYERLRLRRLGEDV